MVATIDTCLKFGDILELLEIVFLKLSNSIQEATAIPINPSRKSCWGRLGGGESFIRNPLLNEPFSMDGYSPIVWKGKVYGGRENCQGRGWT